MAHTAAFADREFGQITPGTGFIWDNPDCPLSHASAMAGCVVEWVRQVKL